jgi:hypothetical protein
MSFRTAALRFIPVVAVVALSIGGIAAGTASAGTTAAAHPARPAAAPPPVDHQLCYNASSSQYKIPAGIRLINQFAPNGFVPTSIQPVVSVHCNPVVKIANGTVYPITNLDAHLACYALTAPTQPVKTVQVTNQFGTAVMTTGQPNLLCVPSWKSLTGPPGQTPTTPPNLNHFTCYPVTMKSGAYNPPPVQLQDEFASQLVGAQVNPVPQELCLPTEKILPSGQVFPIINATQHLLCFPVSQTPIITPVWDENQFGTSPVNISSTKWLCPPSTKTVIG